MCGTARLLGVEHHFHLLPLTRTAKRATKKRSLLVNRTHFTDISRSVMPSTVSKAWSKVITTIAKTGCLVESALVILCCPCLVCVILSCRVVENCAGNNPRNNHTPRTKGDTPPLPTPRINIYDLPVAEQPRAQGCHLMSKISLELRECIYERALGGRLVTCTLSPPTSRRPPQDVPVRFGPTVT
jgi:hypothetical protein